MPLDKSDFVETLDEIGAQDEGKLPAQSAFRQVRLCRDSR